MFLSAILILPALVSTAEPTRAEVEDAMRKASRFMHEKVALRGGYVWVVSADLAQRWGEVPARPSQVWLQGGTEAVGQVMLDAYAATSDDYYLAVARKAVDAIVYGQLPEGGWHYFIDFDPSGIPAWYESVASRFLYGYEEYRYFYGNATFDDSVTPAAARLLLRFYNDTLEAAYREPVLDALDFILEAQYPNGAWPQRYPLRDDYSHDGFPDYTSYYTLNDGAMQSSIELLLDAWNTLGDPRYLDGAKRGVAALIALQGPDGQAAWGEQHGPDLQPVAARTHEPAGYVVRESLGVIGLLTRFYLMTGDKAYLEPVPRALEWFERINRESAAQKYPTPRYWEPGTNKPVYVVRVDERMPDGYGKFIWTSDPVKARCDGVPCEADGRPVVDVAPLRATYDEIAALKTPAARAAYLEALEEREAAARSALQIDESVGDIVAALDPRGAWVTDGISVNAPNLDTGGDPHLKVRGISTRVFVDRLSALIATLNDDKGE